MNPQPPSGFRTSLPAILGILGTILVGAGGSSQTLADAGLSAPAGLLGLCGSIGAAIVAYLNQKKAEVSPPPPQATQEDAKLAIQKTLAAAAQQAFMAEDYALVQTLAQARTKKP